MRCIKSIILIGIFLGIIVHSALSQNTRRQPENSLHNAPAVDPLATPKDSTTKRFGDKLLFEFVGGPSMCFFTRGHMPDQVLYHRYALALAVVHRTTKKLDLEAKILWEPKGYLREYWGSQYGLEHLLFKQGVTLDYLTLALTADYYVDCERRLYVGGGVGVGMLTRQWNFTDKYDEDGNKVSEYDAEAFEFRKIEVGLIANVGYRRHVWKNLLVNAQVLGNFGITDLTKKFDPDPYPDKNSNANLALLIGIGIGR